jgi:hypothetical protein
VHKELLYSAPMAKSLKALRKKTDQLRARGQATPGRLLGQAWMDLDAAHLTLEDHANEVRVKKAAKAEQSFDQLVHQMASSRQLDAALLDCSRAVKAGMEEESAMQLMRDVQAACCHVERTVSKQRYTVHLFGMSVYGEHNEVASLTEAGLERLPALAGLLDPHAPAVILGAWPFAKASQWLMDPQSLFLAAQGCLEGLLSEDAVLARTKTVEALGEACEFDLTRSGQLGGKVLLGAYLHTREISQARQASDLEHPDQALWERACEAWHGARGEVSLLLGAPRNVWDSVAEATAWELFQGMNLGRLIDDNQAVAQGVRLQSVCLVVDPMHIPGAPSDTPTRTLGVFSDGSQLEKPIFQDYLGFLLADIATFLEEGMGVRLEISTHANLEATLSEIRESLSKTES